MRTLTAIAASLALLLPTATLADPDRGWDRHHKYERKAAHRAERKIERHLRKAERHLRRARAEARGSDRRHYRHEPRYGRVLSVEPVYRHMRHGDHRGACIEWHDDRRGRTWTPTVLGGVIGGAVGYAIGDDHGDPEVATIAGGLIGASLGHDISRRAEEAGRISVQGPCTPRGQGHRAQALEYRVRYRYNGRIYHERMNYDPGQWVALNAEDFPAR